MIGLILGQLTKAFVQGFGECVQQGAQIHVQEFGPEATERCHALEENKKDSLTPLLFF